MDASSKSDSSGGESASRRFRPLEEKLRILQETAQPGASVASVARKHGLNANLLFGWRRLQQQGLLESQRRASPPLLPVKITAPTITPTQRATATTSDSHGPRPTRAAGTDSAPSGVEILLPGEVRIRLQGEAQRTVLAHVLEWLPRR